MKKHTIILSILIFISCFSGCTDVDIDELYIKEYSAEDVVGFSFSEIEEKYGTFDYSTKNISEKDGLKNGYLCGYLVVEEFVGFLGTYPPKYFTMEFDDKNNICYKCYYETGGTGG